MSSAASLEAAPPPAPPAVGAAPAGGSPGGRIASLDILRGIACVLMAIDHVRVYSGLPAGGPTAGIFLTRWITHFVAPAFCFLAGAGAYLMLRQLADTGAVRRFLLTRGLVLVVLELTVIRFLWAFHWSPDFMLAGVIWMLGWCMVLLAPFVALPAKRVGAIGIAIVVLQFLFVAPVRFLPESAANVIGPFWEFVYPTDHEALFGINVLYVLVPWIGVMMAGFSFACLLERPDGERRRLMYRIGATMTVLFLAIATALTLSQGPPAGDGESRPLWMSILDQRKYPASPLFLLMTLGPLIALIPWAERARGAMVRVFETLGRVPMWFYLQHLLVIHVVAMVVMWIRTGAPHLEWFHTAPYTGIPDEARWPLWLLYVIWATCIATLYPICAIYAEKKRMRPSWWMRYL